MIISDVEGVPLALFLDVDADPFLISQEWNKAVARLDEMGFTPEMEMMADVPMYRIVEKKANPFTEYEPGTIVCRWGLCGPLHYVRRWVDADAGADEWLCLETIATRTSEELADLFNGASFQVIACG